MFADRTDYGIAATTEPFLDEARNCGSTLWATVEYRWTDLNGVTEGDSGR
jgi:hypothetical protein